MGCTRCCRHSQEAAVARGAQMGKPLASELEGLKGHLPRALDALRHAQAARGAHVTQAWGSHTVFGGLPNGREITKVHAGFTEGESLVLTTLLPADPRRARQRPSPAPPFCRRARIAGLEIQGASAGFQLQACAPYLTCRAAASILCEAAPRPAGHAQKLGPVTFKIFAPSCGPARRSADKKML